MRCAGNTLSEQPVAGRGQARIHPRVLLGSRTREGGGREGGRDRGKVRLEGKTRKALRSQKAHAGRALPL